MYRLICLPFVALLIAGCQTGPLYVHPQFHQLAPRVVAVMPPANETAELVGAKLCHILMAQQIGSRHYRALDANQVMSFLQTKGVADGGQLGHWDDSARTWHFPKHLTAQKLCADLKVEGVVVGHLFGFGEIITGYYNQRKVDVGWVLVNKDGVTLWMGRGTGFTADVHTKNRDAARAAIAHGARKIAQNLTETPLYREALMATRNVLSTLPFR